MHASEPQLSPRAGAAAKAGNIIEAIKLVREETGLGLREAKALVENSLTGAGHSGKPATDAELPVGSLVALERGQMLDAIRNYREYHHVGLKDAKAAVQRYLDRNPNTKQQFRDAAARRRRPVVRIFRFLLVAGLALAGYLLAAG